MLKTSSNTKKVKRDADLQSGARIGSNDDVLTEVLLRLPAASIVRFKLVSKHWQLLLSDRYFTHRYDTLPKSPAGLFIRNSYAPFDVENRSTPPYHSLDLYFDRRVVRIIQSCNGLLLCITTGRPFVPGVDMFYVFNPTTKQLAIIPPVHGGQKVRSTICYMGLAFHQTDCVHYKLVCIRAKKPRRKLYQIQIYSSDTKKWKISIEFLYRYAVFHNPVYWNGAVHWTLNSRDYMYFEIDDEQLRKLPLPETSSKVYVMYLGESGGHLHLILHNKSEENGFHVNVYEMSNHSGWFVKYQVQLDELPGGFPGMFHWDRRNHFKVIDVVRGEQEKDTFIVLRALEKIITYNVHAKTFKQISADLTGYYEIFPSFHRYMETLSSF